MSAITDQAGMCVADLQGIKERFERMGPQERVKVDELSNVLLTCLSKIAHARDVRAIPEDVKTLVSLLKTLFTSPEEHFPSFMSLKQYLNGAAISVADKSINERLTSLASHIMSPTAVLEMLMAGEEGRLFMSSYTSEEMIVGKIFELLNGYNPLLIDEIVHLCRCNKNNCVCANLASVDMSTANPISVLTSFFLCMNHSRSYSSGKEVSVMVTPELVSAASDENASKMVIEVPLRRLLLSCCTSALSPQDRAVVCFFYVFLLFSRYTSRTASQVSALVKCKTVQILYLCVEMMFSRCSGSSTLVDGGMFVKYVSAFIPMSIMSAPFNVEQAFSVWRKKLSSVAPIMDLVCSTWDMNAEDLNRVSLLWSSKIAQLAKHSKYFKRNGPSEPGLGSPRSVRQVEHYIPYGVLRGDKYNKSVLVDRLGLAKMHSSGNNFPVNCFSVLPELPLLANMGPRSLVVNQGIYSMQFGGRVDTMECGRSPGFIYNTIDRIISSDFQNCVSDRSKKTERDMISEIVRTVVLGRIFAANDIIKGARYLPSVKEIGTVTCDTYGFNISPASFFGVWQFPNTPASNMSCSSFAQLEMSMSRDYIWTPAITELFFTIERVSYGIVSNIFESIKAKKREDENLEITTGKVAVEIVERAIDLVKKEWFNKGGEDEQLEDMTGIKAMFSKQLYLTMREIVINRDMDSLAVLSYSDFLCGYFNQTDDFSQMLTRMV